MDCRIKSGNDDRDDSIQTNHAFAYEWVDHRVVIPGRAVSANPESSGKNEARGWIPGPACGRPGMTFQILARSPSQ
jgi:hypothetical protein